MTDPPSPTATKSPWTTIGVAVWTYLNSKEARRWERALLAGIGVAIVSAIRHQLGI